MVYIDLAVVYEVDSPPLADRNDEIVLLRFGLGALLLRQRRIRRAMASEGKGFCFFEEAAGFFPGFVCVVEG